MYPRISPDGGQVALDVRDQQNDIWVWDFARETLTRLTFDPRREMYPTWTRDGRRVAFMSDREGAFNLYWKDADGTGAVERLTESENSQMPHAFIPDEAGLVFREIHPERGADLRLLALDGDGSSEPLLATAFDEVNAEISPDGLWLAYQSNASGQYEIYVRPFPNVDDGRWQISRGGGSQPLWSPDGRELFYLASPGQLMAVRVQTEPGFAAGNSEMIFEGHHYRAALTRPSMSLGSLYGRTYDVSPDGERFLMIQDAAPATEFILVLNWFQELKRRVPTDN